jgi:hypothetical protein
MAAPFPRKTIQREKRAVKSHVVCKAARRSMGDYRRGVLSGAVAARATGPAGGRARHRRVRYRQSARHDKIGLGGARIDAKYLDAAGSAANQVIEFRNLVQRDGVDAVVGYVSPGNCLAVTPVADKGATSPRRTRASVP